MSFNKSLFKKMVEESKQKKTQPKPKDRIVDPMGQWKYPGQVTRIPGNRITMKGVPYPVLGRGSDGSEQMMYSGRNYSFPGSQYVDEFPLMQAQDGKSVDSSWNPNLAKKDFDFLNWYYKNTLEGQANIPYDSPESVYDFYSYFKNTPKSELSDPNVHFPDTYKYPNHPTFSNESIYSTPENPGGYWEGENYFPKGKFIYNKKNGGDISIPNLEEGNWLDRYNKGGSTTSVTTKPPVYKNNTRDKKIYSNIPIVQNEDYKMLLAFGYKPEEAKKTVQKQIGDYNKWALKKYGKVPVGYYMNKFDDKEGQHLPIFRENEVKELPELKMVRDRIDIKPFNFKTPSITKQPNIQPKSSGDYVLRFSEWDNQNQKYIPQERYFKTRKEADDAMEWLGKENDRMYTDGSFGSRNYYINPSTQGNYQKGGQLTKFQNLGEVKSKNIDPQKIYEEQLAKNIAWYEGRKSNPRFKEEANIVLDRLKQYPQTLTDAVSVNYRPAYYMKSLGRRGAYDPITNKLFLTDPEKLFGEKVSNKIINDPKIIESLKQFQSESYAPSVIGHEINHLLQKSAMDQIAKHNKDIYNLYDYKKYYDQYKKDFTPQSHGEIPGSFAYMTGTENIHRGPFTDVKKMQNWEMMNPLSNLREIYKIDPSKDTTPEQMEEIEKDLYKKFFDKNLNSSEREKVNFMLELFRATGGAKGMSDLNNTVVKNESFSSVLPFGKHGIHLPKAQVGKNVPAYLKGSMRGDSQMRGNENLSREVSLQNTKRPLSELEHRKMVYNTIRPSDYFDTNNYARYLFNNQREEFDDERSEEAFRIYLGLEDKPKYFRPSIYRPTINRSYDNGMYYSVDPELENDIFESFKDKVKLNEILPTSENYVKSYFDESDPSVWKENGNFYRELVPGDKNLLFGRPMVSNARALGKFVVSRGKDKKGEYLSYADQYDFPDWMQNKMKGKPYKIYGRIYYPNKKEKGGEILKADNGFNVTTETTKPTNIDVLKLLGPFMLQQLNPVTIAENQQRNPPSLAVQLLDPSGVSNYGNVKTSYENMMKGGKSYWDNFLNALNFEFELAGSLPIVGTVPKLIKAGTKTKKTTKAITKPNIIKETLFRPITNIDKFTGANKLIPLPVTSSKGLRNAANISNTFNRGRRYWTGALAGVDYGLDAFSNLGSGVQPGVGPVQPGYTTDRGQIKKIEDDSLYLDRSRGDQIVTMKLPDGKVVKMSTGSKAYDDFIKRIDDTSYDYDDKSGMYIIKKYK